MTTLSEEIENIKSQDRNRIFYRPLVIRSSWKNGNQTLYKYALYQMYWNDYQSDYVLDTSVEPFLFYSPLDENSQRMMGVFSDIEKTPGYRALLGKGDRVTTAVFDDPRGKSYYINPQVDRDDQITHLGETVHLNQPLVVQIESKNQNQISRHYVEYEMGWDERIHDYRFFEEFKIKKYDELHPRYQRDCIADFLNIKMFEGQSPLNEGETRVTSVFYDRRGKKYFNNTQIDEKFNLINLGPELSKTNPKQRETKAKAVRFRDTLEQTDQEVHAERINAQVNPKPIIPILKPAVKVELTQEDRNRLAQSFTKAYHTIKESKQSLRLFGSDPNFFMCKKGIVYFGNTSKQEDVWPIEKIIRYASGVDEDNSLFKAGWRTMRVLTNMVAEHDKNKLLGYIKIIGKNSKDPKDLKKASCAVNKIILLLAKNNPAPPLETADDSSSITPSMAAA